MARSINQVVLMGRLTRDPETRTTTSGKNITSFSLAVDRQGKDDGADFFDITAWEKLGDLVAQYLNKGSRAIVQGRLRQDSWDDRETGKKRTKIEVVATDVTFLDSASEAQEQRRGGDVVPDDISGEPIDLSAIPF